MTQISPTVSVVLPAFNAAATIVEAIHSVLAQSFHDFELLVCDDASQDETASLIREFSDTRIRLIRNESNTGPGGSRDRAIAVARGRWIAFLDADDAWAPNRLERLLAFASKHGDGMIFDDLFLCQQKAGRIVPWKPARLFPAKSGEPTEISLSKYLSGKTLLIKPLVSRSAITNLGLRHSARRYGEDAEFFIRLLHAGVSTWYVNIPLYHYRLTPGSLSTQVSRSERMTEMLCALNDELNFTAEVRGALKLKLARLKRKANYDRFLSELGRTGFRAAPGRLLQEPQLVVEFARRLPHAAMSRLRSWLHGSAAR